MYAHDALLQRLIDAHRKGRLGHALLLTGGGGHGAYAIAVRVAELLICPRADDDTHADDCNVCRRVRAFSHPDMLCVSPLPTASERQRRAGGGQTDPVMQALASDPYAPLEVGANWGITAGQAREVIQWASMTPWEGRRKVALIAEAEKVTEPTADILLKTLEEPPESVTIILVTARPQDLLPTVRSRCHGTRVPPLGSRHMLNLLAERGVATDSADAEAAVAQAGGDFWRARALLGGEATRLRRGAAELIHAALDPKRTTADVMAAARQRLDGASAGEVSELVRWVVWWLRDMLLAHGGAVPAREDVEHLLPLAKRMGPRRLMRWLEEADRAYEMLGRNVTPPAVVTALLLYPRDERRIGNTSTFPPLDLTVAR